MVIVFSWWQWNGCSRGSISQRMRVPRVSVRTASRTSERVGWKAGTGAPAHTSTRTSMRSASSASSAPATTGGSPLDELEVRREVPAGDVDEVARALHGLGDRGQRLRAVDEDVERAALARRRIAGRPQAVVGRLERPLPAQAPQAAAVLGRHGGLDRVADGGVGVADEGDRHG